MTEETKFILICVGVVAIVGGLAAVAKVFQMGPPGSWAKPVPDKPVFIYKVDGRVVREFLLSDGTRCVLTSEALSCSWGHK